MNIYMLWIGYEKRWNPKMPLSLDIFWLEKNSYFK